MTDVKKFGKKLFTLSVVSMTILWSVGVAALVPAGAAQAANVDAADIEAGDVIKRVGDTSGAVYLINEDMERMYFPNSQTYHTWFEDFSGLKVVDADFDEWWPPASQSVVAPRPGSNLLFKTTASARVYAMSTGNQRLHIADEASAAALYGANWASMVTDWPDFVMSDWVIAGEEISEPYDGYVASNGGENYQFMDSEWLLIDGDLPDFISPFAYASFDDYSVGSSTVTGASLTEDPTQLGLMPSTPTSAGSVTVALATDTPAAGYVYMNSTHNAFTKVRLTAGSEDVTIDSMVVARQGAPATDAAFTGANILKDGVLLASSYKSFNSSHQVTFTEDVKVPANSTVELTLVGKMISAATYAGEAPKLALVEVNTGASVSGSLPIVGNSMTINGTVVIGVATISESPDLGTLTEEVGTPDVELLNVKISNDSSNNIDLQVDSIRFNNTGSADDADVDNLELVVDGDVIATSEMVSNYVKFDLSNLAKAKILNGKNETFTLRGDIVGGSARTLDFDIKKADDIMVKDLLNKAYPTPSTNIESSRTITISRGTLNVSKTNTIQAGNIPEDTTDLEFASWNFKVAGEPITISSLSLYINVNGDVQAADFTLMKLVDSTGKALTGTFDGVGAGDGTVTTSDSFTLSEGDNEIKLIGKLNSDPAVSDWVEFGIDFSYEAGLDAKGDVTGDAITIETTTAYAYPNAIIYANRRTITTGALSVTTISQPAALTVAAGTAQQQFSTISLDATASSEDIKITAFSVNVTTTAAETNQIQNIVFKVNDTTDGSYRTLGTTKNGSLATAGTDELITVSLPTADHIIVKKGTAVTMKIYADISASCSANDEFQIHINNVANDAAGTSTVTAEGVLTGASITEVYSAAQASVMTVGAAGGQVSVALASDTPSAKLMAAGTTVSLAAFSFLATTTEDVEVDYLYLTQVVVLTASSSFKDYDQIWFEDSAGNEIAGTKMSPTSTKPYLDFADDAFIVEADGSAEVLYLKAKLATIGSCASLTCSGANGTPAHQLGYKINDAAADVVAVGHATGSGTTEFAGNIAPTGKTHYGYKAYPVVSKLSVATALANGTRDLYKFQVSAVNGDIALGGFTFDISTTTASLVQATCYLYDVTESAEQQINDTGGCGSTTDNKTSTTWYTTGLVVKFAGHGDDWDTTQTNDQITVSPSQPRTILLRGNVTGSASGASISVGLAGDASALNASATNMIAATAIERLEDRDDFWWSDLNDNAHSDATTDWTNGYLVSGLNSSTSTLQTIAYGS